MRSIQFFKSGKHTAMSGTDFSFSEAELQACVAAYNPSVHEAPIVVGHPKLDDPAFGWVKSISFADGYLSAEPTQVNPQFAEMVKAGSFKKVSAAFYAPDAKNNPVPGVFYLRHIGFLGAKPPAIPGLRGAEFGQNADLYVEFSDWDGLTVASLFRRIRDYIIGRDGLEKANEVIPAYEIDSLQINAATDNSGPFSPSYAEEQERMKTVQEREADVAARETAVATKEAAIATREQAATTREAAFAERETKIKTRETELAGESTKAAQAANVAFAEGLVKEGKLLPREKDGAIAIMNGMIGQAAVEFGEGDAKTSKTPLQVYQEQLSARAKQVTFGESGADKDGNAGTVEFAAPAGSTVDADALLLHQKAVAYQAAYKCDYVTAVKAVGGN